MLDPSKLSDEEIDRLLSSSSGGQAQLDPSSLSDEQIDAMLSQNQPMGQMGQPTPPPSQGGQMPGLSAPTEGEGGTMEMLSQFMKDNIRCIKRAIGFSG